MKMRKTTREIEEKMQDKKEGIESLKEIELMKESLRENGRERKWKKFCREEQIAIALSEKEQ